MRKIAFLFLGLSLTAQAAFDSINKVGFQNNLDKDSNFSPRILKRQDLVVKSLDRSLDMSSQLVKMSHKVTVENTGKGAIKSFLFSVDPAVKDKVAYISASSGGSKKTYLRVSETKVQGHLDKAFWKVTDYRFYNGYMHLRASWVGSDRYTLYTSNCNCDLWSNCWHKLPLLESQ